MCNDGMAASSLACEASAPLCQAPHAWVVATTSMKPPPGSMRGGATGYSQKTTNPITLVSNSMMRSGR
jgi:hypothetical protein